MSIIVDVAKELLGMFLADARLTTATLALVALASRVGTVRGYFNNHFQGHSPASARTLQRLLGQQPVEPAALREQAELFDAGP